MTTIDLVLTHKWFDMISIGIKREEYRNITRYWTQRLSHRCLSHNKQGCDKNCVIECAGIKYNKSLFTNITHVRFHRGYTSTIITYVVSEIVIDTGNPEWGAEPDKEYYVIRLGRQL